MKVADFIEVYRDQMHKRPRVVSHAFVSSDDWNSLRKDASFGLSQLNMRRFDPEKQGDFYIHGIEIRIGDVRDEKVMFVDKT